MPWVRLDDSFPDHPKIAMLSPAAGWLHVCALCYCGRHLTDGLVPKGVEKRLTSTTNTTRLVNELIRARLWVDEGDAWRIHDYLDYQPSREKVEKERDSAAERQRRAREKAAEKGALRAVNQASDTHPSRHLSRRDTAVSHAEVQPQSRSPHPIPSHPSTGTPLRDAYARCPASRSA